MAEKTWRVKGWPAVFLFLLPWLVGVVQIIAWIIRGAAG